MLVAIVVASSSRSSSCACNCTRSCSRVGVVVAIALWLLFNTEVVHGGLEGVTGGLCFAGSPRCAPWWLPCKSRLQADLLLSRPPRAKHEQSRFGSLRHMHANIFRQSEHVTRSRCFSKRLALEACSEVLDARVTQLKEQAQVAAARDMIALATVAAHARTCWHGAVPDRRADELSTPHRLCFFGCLSDQLINGCVVFRRRGSWRGGALTM